MSHVNKVIDADPHFVIDINTRNIKNVSQTKTSLVQYDHNSERFSFTLPRFIEGHDMMECNSVQVHYFSSVNPETKGVYAVTDLAACEDDAEMVCCTWLISQNVTQTAGALKFMLRFACVAEDGTTEYAWHTNPFTGISISAGMNNAEAVVEQYADILEQWHVALFSLTEEGIRNINTAKAAAIADIENAGARVADSLPDDYVEMTEKVKNVTNALKGTASGEAIELHDVSPLEHTMSVKVRSKNPDVADVTTATVKKYGANILDVANAPIYHTNAYNTSYSWERTATGYKSTVVTGSENGASRLGFYIGTTDELKGKTITVSGNFSGVTKKVFSVISTNVEGSLAEKGGQTAQDSNYMVGRLGTGTFQNLISKENVDSLTFTIPNSTTYSYIAVCFYCGLGKTTVGDVSEWSNIQIQIGDTVAEYEPYKEPTTYTPNADGTVEGVTSLYPSTTLLTDTEGVVIECEYNRDINKAFEELTQAIVSLGGNV